MNQQDNTDDITMIFNQVRLAERAGRVGETPIDSVPLLSISAQKSAENRGTVSVPFAPNDAGSAEGREAHFFELISQAMPVAEACLKAGVSRTTVYRKRATDRNFRELWDTARFMAGDLVEEEADRRGRVGWDEDVFYKGSRVGSRRRFSDRMLIFRLRALKPEWYARHKG